MLNLLEIKTIGNEYRNLRAIETLTLPTDTTIAADTIGTTRFNIVKNYTETWNGTVWVSGGGGSSTGGTLYDPNL